MAYKRAIRQKTEELDAQWEAVKKYGYKDEMKPQIIKNRYGTPAQAWKEWKLRSPHWY